MAIISWMVGLMIMTVYGMAVDAILHCFILDESLGAKKGKGPSYTPEYLKDFLAKT